jgi:hypothetical protein
MHGRWGIEGGFHTIPVRSTCPGARCGRVKLSAIHLHAEGSYQVSGFRLPENRVDDASSGFRSGEAESSGSIRRALLRKRVSWRTIRRSGSPPAAEGDPAQAIAEGALSGVVSNRTGAISSPESLRDRPDAGGDLGQLQRLPRPGRADLKYYNYSNRSIIARSQIHGLTADEEAESPPTSGPCRGHRWCPGRVLEPAVPARAGLDSRPVYEWARGRGSRRSSRTRWTFNSIFPGAYQASESGAKVWDV